MSCCRNPVSARTAWSITSGDGTSDSDGDVTGQDLRDLCSGLLRIDVDRPEPGKGYAVPRDNPFLKVPGARPELWAFGLRNPWRMSIDRATGDMYIGDVGQDLWEMIHLGRRGANYGWSVMEGSHPFQPLRKLGPAPLVAPLIEIFGRLDARTYLEAGRAAAFERA